MDLLLEIKRCFISNMDKEQFEECIRNCYRRSSLSSRVGKTLFLFDLIHI